MGAVKPKPDLRRFLDGHGFDPGCDLVKFDEFGVWLSEQVGVHHLSKWDFWEVACQMQGLYMPLWNFSYSSR